MICLCVISLHLALRRLDVGLSIYSRNVIHPRVELVGIVSPLDEVFCAISLTSRLYHTFDDIPIVCLVRDGLNLPLISSPVKSFRMYVGGSDGYSKEIMKISSVHDGSYSFLKTRFVCFMRTVCPTL